MEIRLGETLRRIPKSAIITIHKKPQPVETGRGYYVKNPE